MIQNGRAVKYLPKKISKSQIKYCTRRKEEGAKFFTEYQTLLGWWGGNASQDILLERWSLKLHDCPWIDLSYIDGKRNAMADFASRNQAQGKNHLKVFNSDAGLIPLRR